MLGRGIPNRPIVIRNDLADPPVLTTAAPVVVASPPASVWFNTHPVLQARSTFEDSSDFNTRTRVVVVTSQPDRKYGAGSGYSTRNTLQDPPVLTTSPPIVSFSSSQLYFNKGFNQVSSAPFIAPPTTGPTTLPQVQVQQPRPDWFNVKRPQVLRNTLQDPPVLTTPGPVVVTSSPARSWFNVKLPQVLDNTQLGTTPTVTPTPSPIVVTGLRSLLYQPTKVIVIDNIQLGTAPTFVRPICYSGTVVSENTFTGGIVEDLILSGSIANRNTFTGTIVDENTFTGTMKGWCMQEVDITAAEFNDESWDFTINSGSPPSPFNITGLTIEMYFKTAAGVSDTDPSTVKLTTPTDIVITSGPAGQGTATLPSADLQSNNLSFYRLDVLQSGKRHTSLYGKVAIVQL